MARFLLSAAFLASIRATEVAPAPGQHCSVQPWAGGGVPVDKSLPPLPKYLAFKHVQKAGGSFMAELLAKMTKHLPKYFPDYIGFYRLIEEQIAVQSVARTEDERDKLFVISGVRNPCDWYVSLWAYTSQWDPQLNDMVSNKFGGDPKPFYDLDQNSNTTKFANWLRWTMGLMNDDSGSAVSEQAVGLMSTRYWESFASGEDSGCYFTSDPNGACPGDCAWSEAVWAKKGWVDDRWLRKPTEQQSLLQTESRSGCGKCYDSTVSDRSVKHLAERPEVREDMEAFDPDEGVDCWVSNENLMKDLEECLLEYERQSGVSLNWKPFRNPPPQPETNKSPRLECSSYFTPELKDLVMKRDRHLFESFGFDTCCGPPSMMF